MSGVNPQGVQVVSFRQPSSEELDHDFLWRISKALPERGRIGIFNRSHYEEVVALRVHPEWIEAQRLPSGPRGKGFWKGRFDDINAFERHLDRSGTKVVKFFLHVSKDEQKRRFVRRLDTPGKEWKFKASDVAERAHWDEYMQAFEAAITATSTAWAPWYVIPADHKPVMQAMVARILVDTIQGLGLSWPDVSDKDRAANAEARRQLEAEDGDEREGRSEEPDPDDLESASTASCHIDTVSVMRSTTSRSGMTTELEGTTTDEVVRPRARGWIHRVSYLVAWPATLLLVAIAPTWPARLSVAVYGATLLTVFWVSSTYHRGSWTAEEFARLAAEGSRRDLPPDRRFLHAVLRARARGSVARVDVGRRVGRCRPRHPDEALPRGSPRALGDHVPRSRVGGGHRVPAVRPCPRACAADPHRGRRAPLFDRGARPRDASAQALPANLRLPRGVARGHRGGCRLSLRGRCS